MAFEAGLQQFVRNRAEGRCEYCHLPASCEPLPFHVDHIIAQKHRGTSAPNNLAFACSRCNGYKLDNIAGRDPTTDALTRLFDPRTDRWDDHFCWNGAELMGLTDIGRTTIEVLTINLSIRLEQRKILMKCNLFALP